MTQVSLNDKEQIESALAINNQVIVSLLNPKFSKITNHKFKHLVYSSEADRIEPGLQKYFHIRGKGPLNH